MNEKIAHSDLVSLCQKDRKIAYAKSNIGWAKKNGLDILVKYFILLANSFGEKTTLNNAYVFVDEVKNSNMNNNLYQTKEEFTLHGENTSQLCFYKWNPTNHFKVGIYTALILIVRVIVCSINATLRSLLRKKDIEKFVISQTIYLFRDYISNIRDNGVHYMLMTDYNLFSSIIAIDESEKSTVIQHGLQMDDLLCYPIRAARYFAWGINTKQIMNNDPKILVTGTYKFNDMKKYSYRRDFSTILFCIGSLDYETVNIKIDNVIRIGRNKGYKCIIKCHPGSLYNSEYWKKLYQNEPVTIYKEELLQDIEFDLAITESSTAIMDFISLEKPFILYDRKESYFGKYDKILPRCESYDELSIIIEQLDSLDFDKINKYLIDHELNSGKCTIYETQKRLDNKYE